MDVKKIIAMMVGGIVGAFVVGIGSFFLIKGLKAKSMNQNARMVVSNYIENIRVGKFEKAYESLAPDVKGWLNVDEYSSCMEAYIDEKSISFKIDEDRGKELEAQKKKEKENYIALAKNSKSEDKIASAQAYSQIEFTYIPVTRVVSKSVGGKNTQVMDKFDLAVIYNEGKPYIHMTVDEYYTQKMKIVFGKALDYVEDSMENESDKDRVSKNLIKIENYIKTATAVPSTFRYKDKATVELAILNCFYKLIAGDHESAIKYLAEAEKIAVTNEEKVRIKTIESEIYMTQGLYSEAINSLGAALELKSEDTELRKDYRRILAMMLDEIEGNLSDGWAQLKSSLSQDDNERERILNDIATLSAEKAIKMKQDAPDGYFLLGSVKYALGDSSQAISNLEKALSLAKDDDTIFRTEVAQILGLARTTTIGKTEEDKPNKELKAYKDIVKTDVRSILIRESKVGGLIDSIR